MWIRLGLIFAFLASIAAVGAQAPLAGAGSLVVEGERGESHGWVVSPATGVHKAAVLHLPPRLERADEPGSGVSAGTVRQAAMLPRAPIALAAWDHRVFMVFAPDEEKKWLQRHVLSTGVVRGAVSGNWSPQTEGRRLPALPSLPGEGELLGIVGTRWGPVALLRSEADGAFDLRVLRGSSWRSAPLPQEFEDRAMLRVGAAVGLFAYRDRVGVSIAGGVGSDSSGVWAGELHLGDEVEAEWEWRPLRFIAGDGAAAPLPATPLFYAAGHHAYVAESLVNPGVEVWTVTSEGAWRLAELPSVTPEWGAAPLDGEGRVAVVWAERVPGRGGNAGRGMARGQAEPQSVMNGEKPPMQEIRRHIAEVSLYTGAVLYEGPVIIRGPVSPQELRLLALAVVALMAVIVIFVLRPEPAGPPLTLPPGYALAEPGRRIAASAIDLVAAVFIASQFLGVGVWELMTLRGVLMPGGIGIGGIFAVLGIGFIMTVLGEWLAGRSLGKLITGCEVVHPVIDRTAEGQIVPSVQPPGPWRAAVRNLVKWTLPPVAMAGLGTPERRHRGDLAAGTAVVIRIEEPEPA